jgi:hypothetical protein
LIGRLLVTRFLSSGDRFTGVGIGIVNQVKGKFSRKMGHPNPYPPILNTRTVVKSETNVTNEAAAWTTPLPIVTPDVAEEVADQDATP